MYIKLARSGDIKTPEINGQFSASSPSISY